MSIGRIEEYRVALIRQSESYQKTKPLLDGLLSNILYTTPKKSLLPTPYELFQDNCAEFYERWLDTNRITTILGDLKTDVQYPTEKHKAMTKMLAFMGLVESIGVTMADMLLILLIANGNEVHTKGAYIKHVRHLSELKDIDWTYKARFLKEQKFEIIKQILNLELRNTVAHLKFSIDENGIVRGSGNNVISLDSHISNFWNAVDTLTVLFHDLGLLSFLESSNRNRSINANLPQVLIVGKNDNNEPKK